VMQALSFWLAPMRLRGRVIGAVLSLVLLYGTFYEPARRYYTSRWAMPLREGGRLVIINPRVSPEEVRVGDLIAFRIEGYRGPGVILQEGTGLERVLAAGGDRVRFTAESYVVNGQAQRRLPEMPAAGELVVPENEWFVWPRTVIGMRRNATSETISRILIEASLVTERSLLGKAYGSWLGRKNL